jgi:TRAP transporter 4TM/12TM fusion protein
LSEPERPTDLLSGEPASEERIQQLVEKYDVESRYRRLSGTPGKLVFAWLVGMSLFHLYTAGIGILPIAIQRAVHLTFAIVAVFLLYPSGPRGDKRSIPWYDWLLAAAGGVVIGYVAVFYNEIARRGAEPRTLELWLGAAAILLVLEAGRRVVGNVLPCLSILFLAYCRFGEYVPGLFQIRGYSFERIVQHMYLTSEGIFGVALGVSATFVINFIIFGAFLSKSGGAKFFNELALALAGHSPGGPAKVAVVASGLLGTINGSSVANVATTGTFTIPLMKRVGYPPEYAGAVEACSSTGGQLMPPIMGAGAFIMSEFLGVSYLRIAAAAILPAILYYLAIFSAVHIKARHSGLRGISREELPNVRAVLKSDGHLLIPIVVVVAALLMKYTPVMAAFFGVISCVAVSWLRPHTRMGVKEILGALEEGARGGLGVALACALVGFVVGTSSLTSLGLTISNNIIEISGGRLFFTLFMAMVASLVLGMGLPTTANYIVCSTIIAPALIGMKVFPLAAHLFVFYFGIMADLTPPVCLAAFTGAGIAGANPGKTGFTATKIALASYFLPYSFVYTPMILLEKIQPLDLVLVFVAATLGIVILAGALEGWMFREIRPPERAAAALLAAAAFFPHDLPKMIAVAGILLLLVYFRRTAPKGGGEESLA